MHSVSYIVDLRMSRFKIDRLQAMSIRTWCIHKIPTYAFAMAAIAYMSSESFVVSVNAQFSENRNFSVEKDEELSILCCGVFFFLYSLCFILF